ncbi:MAG: hypothetical protein ABI905_08625 [Betaproteobacteria bacterium]
MNSAVTAFTAKQTVTCIRPANEGWTFFSPIRESVAGVPASRRTLHAVFIVTRAMRSRRSHFFSRGAPSNARAKARSASGGEDAGVHSRLVA